MNVEENETTPESRSPQQVAVTPDGRLSDKDMDALAEHVWNLFLAELRIRKERTGNGYL